MKGTWRKVGSGLVPIDEDATDSFSVLKDAQELVLDVRASRNPGQHKLLFAVLHRLVAGGVFDSVEDALTALKIAAHLVDTWISPNTGEVYYIPRSIAWERMPQAEFQRFWKRAEYIICTDWLGGNDTLLRDVEKMIDGPEAIGERMRAA